MSTECRPALAHHWLVADRGGERVLAEMRSLFPKAPISTLVYLRGCVESWNAGTLPKGDVIESPLSLLPRARLGYKWLLPLHPWAFASLGVPSGTSFVLSSDAAMVKGLRVPKGVPHVCYCHSPPRYIWDMQSEYIPDKGVYGRMSAFLFKVLTAHARRFDRAAAQRVDYFIANSTFVAERIRRYYGRESSIIHPPVSVQDFEVGRLAEDFYLIVSQLTPYKRVDLAVKAFTKLGKKLVVIGTGSEMDRLVGIAGPSVRLVGRQPFAVVKDHFERCRGFIHPQIEDFGIAAVEAQAAGRPVIAFRGGGALDTVLEARTGVFFERQTEDSLADAVLRFEKMPGEKWTGDCRKNACRFSGARFRNELKELLVSKLPWVFQGYQWGD